MMVRQPLLAQWTAPQEAPAEVLPPLLAAGGMKMVLRLLDAWRSHPSLLNDALRMRGSLLAHRK